jgi:multiple sugar transport system permease protein
MLAARLIRKLGFWLTLFLLCLFAIFPALWMVITIFKRNQDLYNPANNPFLFNLPPTLSHLEFLFTETNYSVFLWNSLFIGTIVVAITLVLAVPAAYSLSRLMGRWGERSSIAIFLVYLIPPTLLFIPLYQIVTILGAANTI